MTSNRSWRPAPIHLALAVGSLCGLSVLADDTIVGTPAMDLQLKVFDARVDAKKVPDRCANRNIGRMYARFGNNAVDMTNVIGFRAGTGIDASKLGFDAFHWVNVVVKDPSPPGWIDSDKKLHKINAGDIYIDPLNGGNVPPGKDAPNPKADNDPWYDSEAVNIKAKDTGNFNGIGAANPLYNLDEKTKGGTQVFKSDDVLATVFGDRPTRPATGDLHFVTILAGFSNKNKLIAPLASVDWGDDDGTVTIGDIKVGGDYAQGLKQDGIQAALKRSGFADWTMLEKACPVEAPPKPQAPKEAPAKGGKNGVRYDAPSNTLSFDATVLTQTPHAGDTALGSLITFGTYRMLNVLPDGRILFESNGDGVVNIGSTSSPVLNANITLLAYDPADNSLVGMLSDYLLSGANPSQIFYDPSLPDQGSDWIAALRPLFDDLDPAHYDLNRIFSVDFALEGDLFALTNGFTSSGFTNGISEFGGSLVPSPGALSVFAAGFLIPRRRRR